MDTLWIELHLSRYHVVVLEGIVRDDRLETTQLATGKYAILIQTPLEGLEGVFAALLLPKP